MPFFPFFFHIHISVPSARHCQPSESALMIEAIYFPSQALLLYGKFAFIWQVSILNLSLVALFAYRKQQMMVKKKKKKKAKSKGPRNKIYR